MAFAVVSLSYVGAKGLNILWSNALGIVLFSGTVMGYNFIKYGLGGPFYLKVTHKSFMPIQIVSFFLWSTRLIRDAVFKPIGLFGITNVSCFYGPLRAAYISSPKKP